MGIEVTVIYDIFFRVTEEKMCIPRELLKIFTVFVTSKILVILLF